jgi:hypothetical protein
MNLSQIIEALPPQVHIRRGELVIHFSTPADLIGRVAETSAALAVLERHAETSRTDGRPDRGSRRTGTRIATGAGCFEIDSEQSPNDPDQPVHTG